MKQTCTLFLVMCSFFSYSQKHVGQYLNYQMEPTTNSDSSYYWDTRKTDSGFVTTNVYLAVKKVEMVGLFSDKENTIRNGYFYWFYPDGTIKGKGRYINNRAEGTFMHYYPNGFVKDSLNFYDDKPFGISISWYSDGMGRDSSIFDARGNGVFVSWFDNGQPSSAGRYVEFGKQQGKWQYFHKNGEHCADEIYDKDSLIKRHYYTCTDSQPGDSIEKKEATFPGGEKAWSKYMDNTLFYPSYLNISNGEAYVIVSATITDEGKITDVEVTLPLYPTFDKIVLKALKNSPLWIPATVHNRRVYSRISERVKFNDGRF